MRITNNMLSKSLLVNLGRLREKMADLQLNIATTKKLRKPSDDPSGVHRTNQLKVLISRNEQFLKNITQASSFVTASMDALDAISELLTRAKEIAIQGNGSTGDDDQARAVLMNSIDQIIEQLLELANSTHNGKFLFGGTKTIGDPPFSRNGDQVVYNGNDGVIKSKIGDGTELIFNKSGLEVFQPGGDNDVFAALLTLKQALGQNTIPSSIESLDKSFKHILTVTSELGTLQNRLSLTAQFIETNNINLTEFTSKTEDTDLVEAIINLQNAENAFISATRSFSELIQTSLINFISQ